MTIEQVLKEWGLFSSLNNAELEEVASLALEKHYEAGATLFRKGDSTQELSVLREGKIALQMILPRQLFQNDQKIGYEVLKGLIKVVASRLDDTRRVLVSEGSLTLKSE